MIIDAHVHVWDPDGGPFGVEYPWLTPELGSIYRPFTLADCRQDMDDLGVSALVLVQASDSLAETRALLAAAAADDRPVRVVGWLPLDDPEAVRTQLTCGSDPLLVGVRHLIHDEPDRDWLLHGSVDESLSILAEHGLSFDAVAERPDLMALIPTIALRHPTLTIVLDHLGKPNIAAGQWQLWADLLADIAACPNVVAKVSGLNTVSRNDWTSEDWAPYVDYALNVFGSERLMMGGDWPFCVQRGDYRSVMSAVIDVTNHAGAQAISNMMYQTAARVYRVV